MKDRDTSPDRDRLILGCSIIALAIGAGLMRRIMRANPKLPNDTGEIRVRGSMGDEPKKVGFPKVIDKSFFYGA